MKRNAILTALLLAAAPVWAQTVVSTSYTNSTPASIPDGNPVGVTEQFTVSGLGGSVTNVQVQLDITGGFTGDLYAYLVDPAGQMAVLLNRAGVDGSNPFGYSDAGFNIKLAATGNDIHYYDIYTPTITGGQLTGTWAADGRSIDPQSAGSVFASTSPTAGLNLYNGLNGGDVNGIWTLFIADLATGGGSPTFSSAVLTIMTVPEPQTWVMLGGGLAVFCLCRSRRGFKR
jgi:hypothetical protein